MFAPGAAIPFPGRSCAAALAAFVLLCCPGLQSPARAAAYPPPGRPDPGAPCAKGHNPPWLTFVCRYMTVDLWRAAGRPAFTAPDGTHWRPWYYGDLSRGDNNLLYEGSGLRRRNEGLLEALQQTDTLPDEYDPAYVSRYWSLFRYTPWSVHFARALGCGPGQAANPYALTGDGTDRSRLLSFGWGPMARDGDDPTGALAAGALPILLALADGVRPARGVINALARGTGRRPDYDRDGEVWRVTGRGGGGGRIKDLDRAAAEAAHAGRLYINAPGRTWRQGYEAAAARARAAGGLLVYVYFAGNGWRPPADDRIFTARFHYVARGAARRASGEDGRIVIYSPARRAAVAPLVKALHRIRVRRTVSGSAVPRHGAAPPRCIGVPQRPATAGTD